jgi:hypothetical protein
MLRKNQYVVDSILASLNENNLENILQVFNEKLGKKKSKNKLKSLKLLETSLSAFLDFIWVQRDFVEYRYT